MKLFFNYSIDCETPVNTPYTQGAERRPHFGGPESWDFAARSVEGFIAQMQSLDAGEGTSLFVYPDVARHQKSLYRNAADNGVEVALHLNGLRYSRLTGDNAKWLGEMTYDQQHEAIRIAKADLEETLGRRCTGYRACYGSANNDTFAILDSLGFEWASNSSRRYRPEFFANWGGSWPYPHHASAKSNLICGNLALYEMPVTTGVETVFDQKLKQPLDLRVETPVAILGEDRRLLRNVIEENLIDMERRASPVRLIVGGSHNTSPYNDRTNYRAVNLDFVVKFSRELAGVYGLEFTPAKFQTVHRHALNEQAY
jgi:hypothetical protein